MALPSYAPRLRTALVLCGTGTAGAYQAGVLRALTEAGVKVDVVAAHGAGAIAAVSGAVDSGGQLWSPTGPWVGPRPAAAYRWRPALRLAAGALGVACLLLVSPLLVIVGATMIYAGGMLASLAGFPEIATQLLDTYTRLIGLLFDPPILPTVVPRLVLLAVVIMVGVLAVSAWRARREQKGKRRSKGLFWWKLLGHPLDPREPEGLALETLWRLTRGASGAPASTRGDIGRLYVELVTDNFGQPGFRELLLGVHDVDARRDVIVGLVAPKWQAAFLQRRVGAGAREAEAIDVAGGTDAERSLVVDALIGGLRVPVASAPHDVTFPIKSYWQGETHRWCDRPELVGRLIDEVARVGVEQVVLVTPAPPAAQPHDMRQRPGDFRNRIGETLRSVETAAFQDAWAAAAGRFSGVFAIRPDHNPLGPFDFTGVYDESSDRTRTLAELMQQGYDDAYRQFIEPVVATGERMEDR
jgi:hypothetical protein